MKNYIEPTIEVVSLMENAVIVTSNQFESDPAGAMGGIWGNWDSE